MTLSIFAGSSNSMLAEGIATALGISLGERVLERYPDGELHVEIQESVSGHDVFLVQPTAPPVERESYAADGTRCEKTHRQGPDPGPDATGAGHIGGMSVIG